MLNASVFSNIKCSKRSFSAADNTLLSKGTYVLVSLHQSYFFLDLQYLTMGMGLVSSSVYYQNVLLDYLTLQFLSVLVTKDLHLLTLLAPKSWQKCQHIRQYCLLCLLVFPIQNLSFLHLLISYPKYCRAIMMKGMVFRYTWVYSKEDTMAHT